MALHIVQDGGAAPAPLPFPADQRWEAGRSTVRTAREGTRINPDQFGVEPVAEGVARAFVAAHHYSASYPAAHLAVGLHRRTGLEPSRLVGVAVFSEGVQSTRAMPKYTGFSRAEGTELGRLVLLPEVAFNGESWFIRRAFAALRAEKPRFRVCLSYSDPVERTAADGERIKPGHFGTIYQASNALFLGRAEGRKLLLKPDGTVLHPYLFNKLAHRRKGWAAAERAIAQAGAAAGLEPRAEGEDESAWCARVRAGLRQLRHPGNLAYAFGLDGEAWDRLRAMHGKGLPYPKARQYAVAA